MGPSQKHLYSRISFLHQAATYLSSVTDNAEEEKTIPLEDDPADNNGNTTGNGPAGNVELEKGDFAKEHNEAKSTLSIHRPTNSALSRLYASQSRSIARKATIRLTPGMKHSVCKTCDTMLLPGTTCSTFVENLSRRGRKPWADVLVMKCNACGVVKRFPIGAKRQRRKTERVTAHEPEVAVARAPKAEVSARKAPDEKSQSLDKVV